MNEPIAVDLYCGLGGWTDGLLAAGFRVIGVDIERHVSQGRRYPAQLILQDARTLHGSQFRHADLIVASSPCQKYSYMAMPWTRAKAQIAYYADPSHPERLAELNELFEQPRRIQREAIEANGGRYIPLVQENVRGAQRWVGRAQAHYGSYYLWGDVPALMPVPFKAVKVGGFTWSDYGKEGYVAKGLNHEAERATKNAGGSWFAVANNTESGHSQNPVSDATKIGGDWFSDPNSTCRRHGSKSNARKEASARIAMIPFALASHVAHVYYPLARGGRAVA